MSSPSRFLALPRELRDIIYQHYVFESDGYHFNFSSGKLRTSDGRPIDLALMYTCKAIAEEMMNVPLERNTVVFSPVEFESESERLKAGRFHLMQEPLENTKLQLLRSLAHPELGKYLSSEIRNKLVVKYPQFAPCLRPSYIWTSKTISAASHYWSQAPSVFRKFVDDLFECLPTEFYNAVDSWPIHDLDSLIPRLESPFRCLPPLSKFNHWSIPSEEESAEIAEIDKIDSWLSGLKSIAVSDGLWKLIKWRYSAASAAIRFFKSLPLHNRLQIKKVLLLEDRISVAKPECHVMGLIPFCQENHQLRIERRVDLWRSILPQQSERELRDSLRWGEDGPRYKTLRGFPISRLIARWIIEALALPAAGMPSNSFSLVFDGDSLPNMSPAIFNVVKEDAVWWVARMQWFEQNEPDDDSVWLQLQLGPFNEEAVRGITDIVKQTSFISCNFNTGDVVHPEQLKHLYYGFNSLRDWQSYWQIWRIRDTKFEIPSSLAANWREFQLMELVSREFTFDEAS